MSEISDDVPLWLSPGVARLERLRIEMADRGSQSQKDASAMTNDPMQQRKDFIRSAAKEAGGKLCDAIENHFGRPQVTSPIGKEYPWHVVVRWIVDGREWIYDELYFDDDAPSASFLDEFMARAVSYRDYKSDGKMRPGFAAH